MPQRSARAYDDYQKLKTEALSEINSDNARVVFKQVKKGLLIKLKKLNINDITEVEDFYLIVAKLSHCASYIWAIKEANIKSISFEDALNQCGTVQVMAVLKKNFKYEIGQCNFTKILDIDKRYMPAKQGWAGLHDRLSVLTKVLSENHETFMLATVTQTQLDSIRQKSKHLKNLKSVSLLNEMCGRIEYVTGQYMKNGNKEAYRESLNAAIDKASCTYKKSRWKEHLDDLANILLQVISPCSVNSASQRPFSFFKNSIKEQLREQIEHLKSTEHDPEQFNP